MPLSKARLFREVEDAARAELGPHGWSIRVNRSGRHPRLIVNHQDFGERKTVFAASPRTPHSASWTRQWCRKIIREMEQQ